MASAGEAGASGTPRWATATAAGCGVLALYYALRYVLRPGLGGVGVAFAAAELLALAGLVVLAALLARRLTGPAARPPTRAERALARGAAVGLAAFAVAWVAHALRVWPAVLALSSASRPAPGAGPRLEDLPGSATNLLDSGLRLAATQALATLGAALAWHLGDRRGVSARRVRLLAAGLAACAALYVGLYAWTVAAWVAVAPSSPPPPPTDVPAPNARRFEDVFAPVVAAAGLRAALPSGIAALALALALAARRSRRRPAPRPFE